MIGPSLKKTGVKKVSPLKFDVRMTDWTEKEKLDFSWIHKSFCNLCNTESKKNRIVR